MISLNLGSFFCAWRSLEETPQIWYLTFEAWFLAHGFVESDKDTFIFAFIESNIEVNFIYIWVDKTVVIGKSVTWGLEALRQEFRIKDLGPVSIMLGMKLSWNRTLRTLFISRIYYIEDLLDLHGMSDWKSFGTHLQSDIHLIAGTDKEIGTFRESGHNYLQAVWCLNNLSQCCWPGLSNLVGPLSQFLEELTFPHRAHLTRVLHHLHGTSNLTIFMRLCNWRLDRPHPFTQPWLGANSEKSEKNRPSSIFY